MNMPAPLSVRLANVALSEAEQPEHAVLALVAAAGTIINRSNGPEMTVQVLLEIVAEMQRDVLSEGLVAERTRH